MNYKDLIEELAALPLPELVESLNEIRAALHDISPFKSEPVSDVELAWLSGLWDGEGSIGSHKTSPTNVGPKVQMSMTCLKTVNKAIEIFKKMGVSAIGYTYQEKMNHHKDSHHIRVNRCSDILICANLLAPYSITKRDQWIAAKEFCEIKMARRRVMPDGRLSRGGLAVIPVTEREFELHEVLRSLNYREKAS